MTYLRLVNGPGQLVVPVQLLGVAHVHALQGQKEVLCDTTAAKGPTQRMRCKRIEQPRALSPGLLVYSPCKLASRLSSPLRSPRACLAYSPCKLAASQSSTERSPWACLQHFCLQARTRHGAKLGGQGLGLGRSSIVLDSLRGRAGASGPSALALLLTLALSITAPSAATCGRGTGRNMAALRRRSERGKQTTPDLSPNLVQRTCTCCNRLLAVPSRAISGLATMDGGGGAQ
jgi:hypothetical protein